MGLVPPQEGFLELLRDRATRTGALLVFDEVITGLRVAPGGAQELTGVIPDLTLLGKIVGGGLPAAAYGGSRELMELVAPGRRRLPGGHAEREPARRRRRARHAAPSSTSRPTCAFSATTRALADGLREAAGDVPGPGLLGDRPADGLLLARSRSATTTARTRCDTDRYGDWCRELLARGVYPPPSQYEAWFPSLAHGPEHVERTLEAAAAAFGEIA